MDIRKMIDGGNHEIKCVTTALLASQTTGGSDVLPPVRRDLFAAPKEVNLIVSRSLRLLSKFPRNNGQGAITMRRVLTWKGSLKTFRGPP